MSRTTKRCDPGRTNLRRYGVLEVGEPVRELDPLDWVIQDAPLHAVELLSSGLRSCKMYAMPLGCSLSSPVAGGFLKGV